jgi:hypothetical protein
MPAHDAACRPCRPCWRCRRALSPASAGPGARYGAGVASNPPRRGRSFLSRLTPGARAALAAVGVLAGAALIYLGVAGVATDDQAPPSSVPVTTLGPGQGSN